MSNFLFNLKQRVNQIFNFDTENQTMSVSNSTNDIKSSNNININILPVIVMEKIFENISGNELINSVILVCKQWNSIIDNEAFWLRKCLKENKLDNKQVTILHRFGIFKTKHIYFSNLLKKNLLRNTCGDEKFQYWHSTETIQVNFENAQPKIVRRIIQDYKEKIVKPNERTWQIETEHNGSEALFDANNNLLKNFATSYYWAGKMQVVELDQFIMDLVEKCIETDLGLKLEINENYAARFDCGSIYKLNVYLVNVNYEIVDSYQFQDQMPQWSEAKWMLASHLFDVKKPFKYIIYYHGGQDTQFWAGFYGSKMTNGSIRFKII
jgi:hypothetical protein